MPSLIEQDKTIEQKRGELHQLFADHTKGDEYDLSADDLLEVNRRNDELGALCRARDEQKGADEIRKKNEAEFLELKRLGAPPMPNGNGNGNGHADTRTVGNPTVGLAGRPYGADGDGDTKSLGERFAESFALAEYKGGIGPVSRLEIDVRDVIYPQFKATMTTATGWAPQVVRGPRLVLSVQTQPRVADVLPSTATTAAGVKYMQETTFTAPTPPAMSVAENTAKPEAALATTEVYAPVVKIAVLIPVTEEQLADVPQVAGYVENRLTLMVRQYLDAQILSGSGTAPQMQGILSYPSGAGANQTNAQPKGTDPTYDQIYKAALQVEVNGDAEASAVVMNPMDWAIIRLTRTANGEYIWGPPNEVGPTQLWGYPVVTTKAITQGTAVVGDFARFSELVTRAGIEIQTSNSHIDAFAKNVIYVRAEMRAAALWYRLKAFTVCTNIAAP